MSKLTNSWLYLLYWWLDSEQTYYKDTSLGFKTEMIGFDGGYLKTAYLTLWVKILQNFGPSRSQFPYNSSNLRLFRPSYNTFYEDMNICHTLCVYHKLLTVNKAVWLFWGALKCFFFFFFFVKLSQTCIKYEGHPISNANISVTLNWMQISPLNFTSLYLSISALYTCSINKLQQQIKIL